MNDNFYKENLYNFTKTASYFLWEYTGYDNALALWRCAEDMAFFAERRNIVSLGQIQHLILNGRQSYSYTDFLRNISYRIYLFTGNEDSKTNWFAAERLVNNTEWCSALTGMVRIFKSFRNKEADADILHSETIKRYYKTWEL